MATANVSVADTPESPQPYLFLSAENTQDIKAKQSPVIVRSRIVDVNFALLTSLEEKFLAEPDGEHELILNVFMGLEYTVILEKIEENRSGSYSWYGKLKDVPMSQVVLVIKNNMVFGNISKPKLSYQVRHLSGKAHAIYEIDPSKFPPTSEPIIPNLKSNSSSSTIDPTKNMKIEMESHISGSDTIGEPHISGSEMPSGGDEFNSSNPFLSDSSSSNSGSSSTFGTQADDGSVVDVLVVYTAEGKVAAGGTSAIETLIDLAESETNAAYTNSTVGHTVRVVGKQEISYSETGFSFSGTLNAAQDGSISGLHDLRNSTGADLVVVLVDGDDSLCGLAFLMSPVTSSFAPYGYSVTQTNCATGNYTFGHEIGHNMSARHDRTNDNTDGSPFDYNHGYVDNVNSFKTIMGTGGNTRIQYFSNPNVSFNGAVTGVAEGNALAADNRLTFQNTALTVSHCFRFVPQFGEGGFPLLAVGF